MGKRESKKVMQARKAPSRAQAFPESNRFWRQLFILASSLGPILSYLLHERIFALRSALSSWWMGVCVAAERRRLPAPAFLASAATVACVAVFLSLFTWGTTVSYGDTRLGTVAAAGLADETVSQVESELVTVLGSDFSLDMERVSYDSGFVPRNTVVEPEALSETLNDELNLVTYGYTLCVDGRPMGVTRTREALDDLLAYLTTAYRNENTISVDFVENIEIKEGPVPVESISNLGDIALELCSTKAVEQVYTVVKGDTWSKIAESHDMTSEALQALNPGFDVDRLRVGDEILISAAVPYLTVKVTQTEYYTSDIPFEVQYVDDDTMWEGDTKVLTKGVYGQSDVVAEVTYVNNEETDRTVISTTVTSEPVTEVQAKGTLPRPDWAPTGTFRWPTHGTITSRYGYRHIFGSSNFHTGLDIANSYGTDIVAADGGIVTYAGWQGGYGYLVKIDHQNGYVTYYAHNSSLLVSVGDKVFKGEHIAEMGMTGKATGNHCHFEVHYNGERQNPANYLP